MATLHFGANLSVASSATKSVMLPFRNHIIVHWFLSYMLSLCAHVLNIHQNKSLIACPMLSLALGLVFLIQSLSDILPM